MINKKSALNGIDELENYDHLFVGFSGGLDSTVLLHQLSRCPVLQKKLTAVYINHGLSPNAALWQSHCQQLCQQWQVRFLAIPVDFDRDGNIEEAARIARYQVFATLVKKRDCLLLGHHLDDQAETLLLQLCRGAGVDGLAAISEKTTVGEGDLRRPLLNLTRKTLQAYAGQHHLSWLDDESNEDIRYSRNFLRHKIVPLLQKRWAGIARNLARTAEHCRAAQANLNDLALLDCPQLTEIPRVLAIGPLLHLNRARLANVLRVWLRQNSIRMPNTSTFNRLIDEMIFAAADGDPQIQWKQVIIKRYQHQLYLSSTRVRFNSVLSWTNFPQALSLGTGLGQLEVKVADEGLLIPPDSKMDVRFRQGGESFYWHGQNKSLKKLLQEWKVPPWQRPQIPLLYINDQLAAVIGYALSDHFYQRVAGSCYCISHIIN